MRILEYWPSILRDLVEFQRIAEAQQPDYDVLTETVNNLHNEFSLFTLSERGAVRWEEILSLQAKPGDSIEVRRNRILTKFLSQLPYTYRAMLRYLETISGGDYAVNLDVANYELYVSARLSGYDQRTALIAALTDMLPANIVLILKAKITQAVDNAQAISVAYMTHKIYRKSTPVERGTN